MVVCVLNEAQKRRVRASLGFRIAHQTGDEMVTDTQTIDLMREDVHVETAAKMAFLDGDARGCGDGLDPILLRPDENVARRTRSVIELNRGGHENTASRELIAPRKPPLEERYDSRLPTLGLERGRNHPSNEPVDCLAQNRDVEVFLRREMGEKTALRHPDLLGQAANGDPNQPVGAREVEGDAKHGALGLVAF